IAMGVDEIVCIVGYLRDEIETWMAREYPRIRPRYVLQAVQDGTAGAVALAEPFIDDEVLIVFPDAVLELDYGLAATLPAEYAGVIWAKEVEDYQRYGVILTHDDGTMARIVEKPSEPISKLANIGLYYIRDHALLYEGVRHVLAQPTGPSGEFYLTDAFQYMVDQGARLLTAPVEGWWDAGKPETLLETNAHLVGTRRGGVDPSAVVEDAEIVEPVRVEAGAVVRGGRLGPGVTVEEGARVDGSVVRNSILGRGSRVEGACLHDSLVGDAAVVRGADGSVFVTDHSVVEVRRPG
ncbi:MAG: sugar phosphate nucleotidyltransferase, partial [Gemmatimonadota bacterium]|nr:sugar phosphate nucleotidyltransferase [Gemmatimonadota bacterium]